MRVVSGIGLLVALAAAVMIIPEITTLENTAVNLSGMGDALVNLFNKLSLIGIAVALALMVGTAIAALAMLSGRH